MVRSKWAPAIGLLFMAGNMFRVIPAAENTAQLAGAVAVTLIFGIGLVVGLEHIVYEIIGRKSAKSSSDNSDGILDTDVGTHPDHQED